MRTRLAPSTAAAIDRGRRRVGGLFLLVGLAAGCGPDPQVIAKQDEEIRREYERQKAEPKWLTPEQKRIRRERLELEFGGSAPR